ncbi:DnaJ domain-containing protein [Aspergillus novoparasiticus]|uniref:DnaJ domain-containing protein n=1 Tax=Aspergillus novoparasiticus TaxID=986946 RepID=A0A5N6E665_9EURO|nr:DnaJ domain-containing protein [Aspergillus novoparasiticus]
MAKANIPRDYYAVLGLQPTADSEEIKAKYKKLALEYHPDRNHGKEKESQVKFQEISNAYTILSDPKQRSKYDESRRSAGPGKYSSGQRKPNPPPKAPPGRNPTAFPRESRAANQRFPPRPQSRNHNPSFHTPGYTGNTHHWSSASGWFRRTGWKRNPDWANYNSTLRPEPGAYIPKHPGAAPRPPPSSYTHPQFTANQTFTPKSASKCSADPNVGPNTPAQREGFPRPPPSSYTHPQFTANQTFTPKSASKCSADPNVGPNTPAQREGFSRPDFSATPKATAAPSQNCQERLNTKDDGKKATSHSGSGLEGLSDNEQPRAKQDGHSHGLADVGNGPGTSNPHPSQSGSTGQQPLTTSTTTEPSVLNWVAGLNDLPWPIGDQNTNESSQRQGNREHTHSEPASQQLPTPLTGVESTVNWVDELNNLQLTIA